MELYPAIDLRAGRCVRLAEGDFAAETVYDPDPLSVAQSFAAAGARWLHVVDLDAARTGEPVNREVIAEIAAEAGLAVQAGGGVRTEEDAAELLEAGVSRVVLGTAAVENPAVVERLCAAWPRRVAIAIDHRRGEVRVRGWTEGTEQPVAGAVAAAAEAGAAAVVVTDVSRDGMMSGPDLDGLADVLRSTSVPVIASGGVAGIDDIAALAGLVAGGRRLSGVIAGRAIYEGALDVSAAVELLAGVP